MATDLEIARGRLQRLVNITRTNLRANTTIRDSIREGSYKQDLRNSIQTLTENIQEGERLLQDSAVGGATVQSTQLP